MKLIVDIPDEMYDWFENGFPDEYDYVKLWRKIEQSIPLSKEHERKFEEIVVSYPLAEICTYPEYKGKPYFQIKYEENGEHIVGFGTYNPEVFSKYLQEYFIIPVIIEADEDDNESYYEKLKNIPIYDFSGVKRID